MTDAIIIRRLTTSCIIGIFPKERTHYQDVVFDIEMTVDTLPAATSDEIHDTVDYKALKDRILESVSASRFKLIEALAEHVASLCLAENLVEAVTVTVDKPGALTGADSVAVRIQRP